MQQRKPGDCPASRLDNVLAGTSDYMKKALTLANQGFSFGAGEMNRTPDLLITNELLYRLSYTGESINYTLA